MCSKCSSPSVCLECFGGLGLYKSECVTCPKGTYLSGSNCIGCPKGCIECTSASICQACSSSYTLLSSEHCVSESKSAQANITGAALDSAAAIGNAVTAGTSMPTNFGLVSKSVKNIRYLNVTVSSELEETFYSWKISSGFISMPNSWDGQSSSSNEVLPLVFERYKLGSLFLVNYWKSFVMIMIGLVLFIVFKAVDMSCQKRNKTSKVGAASRALNVFASNFTLTQVYGSLDDIVFFFVLQTRSPSFQIDFGKTNFGLSVFLMSIAIIILGGHIIILRRYRRSKGISNGKSALESFLQKHENVKVFFQDFKDSDFLKQSFLLIYVGRSIISNIIITTLFEYPLLQTLMLTGLNVLILAYLMICRPFKEILNASGQYFCEGVLLMVNVSMLGMTIIDEMSEKPEGVVENFSKLIIVLNMALLVGSLVFMLLSIGKTLYIIYKSRKGDKKSLVVERIKDGESSLKIVPPVRLQVPSNMLDQSVCDPLNLSQGQSFMENTSNILNSSYGTMLLPSSHLGIPSQNISDTSISNQLNDDMIGAGIVGLNNRPPKPRRTYRKVSRQQAFLSPYGIGIRHQLDEVHVVEEIPYMVSNLNPPKSSLEVKMEDNDGENKLDRKNLNKDNYPQMAQSLNNGDDIASVQIESGREQELKNPERDFQGQEEEKKENVEVIQEKDKDTVKEKRRKIRKDPNHKVIRFNKYGGD